MVMKRPTLMMTRPRAAAERFVSALDPRVMGNIDVLFAPLMEIVAFGAVPENTSLAAAIFTSAQAVSFAPDGARRTAYCVGAQTAAQAQAMGWNVQETVQDADELVAALSVRKNLGPLVHLAGRHRRGDIAERLRLAGAEVEVIELYQQRLLPLSSDARAVLSRETPVIVPLFSPRTASQFATECRVSRAVHILAMSHAVADALGKGAFAEVRIAEVPTADEMRRDVENLVRRITLA